MSITVTFNGQTYTLPQVGESGWGDEVTNYLSAVSTGTLQKNSGSFDLLEDLSFGTDYGIVVEYIKSQSNNIATGGVLRLANTDSVEWRNGANDGNLALTISADKLQFNGVEVVTDPSNYLSKAGGTFTLTNDVDFGGTYGAKLKYVTTQTTNPASSGVLRLGNTDSIEWRSGANDRNLALSISADKLYYDGNEVVTDPAQYLSKAGGNFTLLDNLNFGDDYIIRNFAFASTNATGYGAFALGQFDVITWDSGVPLSSHYLGVVDGELVFNGNPISGGGGGTATQVIASPGIPASEGVVRLTDSSTIAWRNFDDTGNHILNVVDGDLMFNGNPIRPIPENNLVSISGIWETQDESGAALAITGDGWYGGSLEPTSGTTHITASLTITYPTTSNTNDASIRLPNAGSNQIHVSGTGAHGGVVVQQDTSLDFLGVMLSMNAVFFVKDQHGTRATNADLSGATISLTVTYDGGLVAP